MVDERELLRRKDLESSGGSYRYASQSTAAADGGGEEEEEELAMLHFQDVREELELSGHNLTSVLNNPRETFMDSLYEAAFEAEPPLPDLEVVRAVVHPGMREVTPQVWQGLLLLMFCKCGVLLQTAVVFYLNTTQQAHFRLSVHGREKLLAWVLDASGCPHQKRTKHHG